MKHNSCGNVALVRNESQNSCGNVALVQNETHNSCGHVALVRNESHNSCGHVALVQNETHNLDGENLTIAFCNNSAYNTSKFDTFANVSYRIIRWTHLQIPWLTDY